MGRHPYLTVVYFYPPQQPNVQPVSHQVGSQAPTPQAPQQSPQTPQQPVVWPFPQAFQQPTVQQPAVQQPAVQQPAVQQPAVQQPAVRQPAVQQPAVQQPAVQQPTPAPAQASQPQPAPVGNQPILGTPPQGIPQPLTEASLLDKSPEWIADNWKQVQPLLA